MPSPELVAHAERTISETDLRALALAKNAAQAEYSKLLLMPRKGLTDDLVADLEIRTARALKAAGAATVAFEQAL